MSNSDTTSCRGRGSNPHAAFAARDFKSVALRATDPSLKDVGCVGVFGASGEVRSKRNTFRNTPSNREPLAARQARFLADLAARIAGGVS